MTVVSRHRCAFAFVQSHSTCWFSASTVLDMLEFFRSHFFQENWASVVVNILLQGITPFAGGGNKCREEAIGLLVLGSPGSGAHRS
jgi:hypothetical protein